MVALDYNPCVERVFVHEGGFTNDPRDPGGPTNWGITIFDARMYWKPGATADDVRLMPKAVAENIYRRKYWIARALSADDLMAGVDDSLFDYRVNSGAGRADKVLRRVVGLNDNAPNADVLLALGKRDAKAVVNAINDERLRFLRSLSTFDHFGSGWTRRVAEVRAFSLQLAAGASVVLPQADPATQKAGKGHVPPSKGAPAVKTGGTVATAASSGLAHWFGAHPELTAAILVGGGAAIAGGVIYLEHRRQLRQEMPTPGLVAVPEKAAA